MRIGEKEMENKMVRIGDDFNMVGETTENGSAETYSVRNLTNLTAINLVRDVSDYRKGYTELKETIELETNALNALAKATEVLR
jgi:hypothetical protein